MVGGRRNYYTLPDNVRALLTDKAADMYDLGVTYSSAEKAEKVDKRGFVYVISNPAWPWHVKIGRAFNPMSRLSSYQTGGPHRDYKLHYSMYFEDCHAAEQEIHSRLKVYRDNGEWFRMAPSTARATIQYLKETT